MGAVETGNRDFYDVLGVPRDADAQAIKRAFRARARECHPDLATAARAPERFRELANAYDVLSTSQSRRLYDRFGYRGPGNGGFDDRSGIVAELQLEPDEALRGTARRVRFDALSSCPACDAGRTSSLAVICKRCAGTGRVKQSSSSGAGRLLRFDPCPDCSGSGSIADRACAECGGEGTVTMQKTADVVVPPGAEDGQAVYLPADEGRVLVRVLPFPDDPRLVRYGAAAGLLVALAFLTLLLFG